MYSMAELLSEDWASPGRSREGVLAAAVPEDVGVFLGQVGQRLGDLTGGDHDDIDALIGEVAQLGSGLGLVDLVDIDRIGVPVGGGEVPGTVNGSLVVGTVVGVAGHGHGQAHNAITVVVHRVGLFHRRFLFHLLGSHRCLRLGCLCPSSGLLSRRGRLVCVGLSSGCGVLGVLQLLLEFRYNLGVYVALRGLGRGHRSL